MFKMFGLSEAQKIQKIRGNNPANSDIRKPAGIPVLFPTRQTFILSKASFGTGCDSRRRGLWSCSRGSTTSNDNCIAQFGSDAAHALLLHNFTCLANLDLHRLAVSPENRPKTLPLSINAGTTLERQD